MLCGKTLAILNAASAFTQDGKTVIGKDNNLPWWGDVPSDLRRFKKLTTQPGKTSMGMGRITFECFPRRPLPGRENIVITRNPNYQPILNTPLDSNTSLVIARSLQEAMERASSDFVWIIGGGEIYKEALPHADFLYQTIVHKKVEGDTFFPQINIDEWRNVEYQHLTPGDAEEGGDKVPYSYLVFQRIKY